MRRTSPVPRFVLGTVLLAVGYPAVAPAQTAYRAAYVASALEGPPPTIDGRLDEPLWSGALWDNRFRTAEDANPSQETLFAMVYDDQCLYVAISLSDEDPAAIARVPGERDRTDGDRIALAFATTPTGDTSYVFGVNAAGVVGDELDTESGQARDSAWNAEWQAAVSIDEWGWHAELRIPAAEMGIGSLEGQTWGMQLTRMVDRLREISTWQPMSPDLGAPGSYGRLVFR